jgi:hypothetical protein
MSVTTIKPEKTLEYIPFISLVADDQSDAAAARTGSQCVRVQQRQGLAKLALRVSLKLFSAHGEHAEEVGECYRGAALDCYIRIECGQKDKMK